MLQVVFSMLFHLVVHRSMVWLCATVSMPICQVMVVEAIVRCFGLGLCAKMNGVVFSVVPACVVAAVYWYGQ